MGKHIEAYSVCSEMRNDLMKVYREVAQKCLRQNDAWVRTVKHPAPRFYIYDEKQAAHKLKQLFILKKIDINRITQCNKRKYEALWDAVCRLSNEPSNVNKSFTEIVRIAINSPAPEFFISPGRFSQIFREIKFNRFDDYGRSTSHINRMLR